MKITFIGAAHEVTGSCTLIEVCGKHIVVDCGMEQGKDTYENADLPVSPSDVDALFLTHAHIDHSGKIPALVANGYSGPIYSTYATKKLCDIMLMDSAHIQESEAEWRNRKSMRSGGAPYTPIYTIEDAQKALNMFVTHSYNEQFDLFDFASVEFTDAGHLLGSSSVKFTFTENGETRTILFSGDIGNVERPLIRDPQKPEGTDYVVIESTYGDRLHGERPDYVSQLTKIIQDTLDRGGNVVVPSFAVGRTQELLYLIRAIKDAQLVKGHDNFPVYVDSPLAVEATGIYASGLTDYYDAETLELLGKGINPITFENLNLSVSSAESMNINNDMTPKIILSASGMCEAGRIRHHLKHNLWRSESTILFVGYQTEGTVGRKLLDGAKTVKLFGEEIAVRAKIVSLDGISGHADMNMLTDWLRNFKTAPKKVFVNHGDDAVCDFFAKKIKSDLGYDSYAPHSGDIFDLISGKVVFEAPVVLAKGKMNSIFDKLLSAGKRLLSLIEKMKGHTNKELEEFIKDIDAIYDKYKE